MTNALAHNQQAATHDSTSTGTQARYNNWVIVKQEAATRGAKRLQSTAHGLYPCRHSPDGATKHSSGNQAHYSFIDPERMKG